MFFSVKKLNKKKCADLPYLIFVILVETNNFFTPKVEDKLFRLYIYKIAFVCVMCNVVYKRELWYITVIGQLTSVEARTPDSQITCP